MLDSNLLRQWVIKDAETHIWFREYPTGKIKCQICGMERLPDNQVMIDLHKRLETRILKVESPVLGMKIDGYRKEILDIIEDEFGKLDNI